MARSLVIGFLIYTAFSAVANGHADPLGVLLSSVTSSLDSGIISASQASSSNSHGSVSQSSNSESKFSSSQNSDTQSSGSKNQSSSSQSSSSQSNSNGSQSSSSQSSSAQSKSNENQSSSSQSSSSQISNNASQSSSSQSNSAQSSGSENQSSSSQSSSSQSNSNGSKSNSDQSSSAQSKSNKKQSSSSQSSSSQINSNASQSSSSQGSSAQNSSSGKQSSSSSQTSSNESQSSNSQSSNAQNNSSENQSSTSQNSSSQTNSNESQSSNSHSSSTQNSSNKNQSSSSQKNSSQTISNDNQASNSQSSSAQSNSSKNQSSASQNSNSQTSSNSSQSSNSQSNSAQNSSSENQSNASQNSSSQTDSNGNQSSTSQSSNTQNSSENQSSSNQSSNNNESSSNNGSSSENNSGNSNQNSSSYCSKPKPKPPQCGINEERKCIQPCPPQTSCENRNKKYFCPAVIRPCKSTCVCKPGFYRNAIGECITEAECNQCSKPNEFFSCGSACDNECSTLGKQNRTNCPIINIKCNPMCYCKDGYARDSNGNCIPVDKCKPKPPQCGINEERKCIQPCPPQTSCENRNKKYFCPAVIRPCKSTCVCKPGFYRNAIGECITEAECNQCSKPNEFFSCGSACDNECSTLGKQNRTNCPIINIKCNPMCYCKDEFARDSKGNCIPVDKCKKEPKPLQCGPNEVIDDCPYKCGSERCPRSEQEANLSQVCVKPDKCPPPACRCRFNYSRDKNGKCIPTRDCPAFSCKGINEEYNSCPPFCPTDDCSQATPTGKCPLPGRIGTILKCKPTCRCKKGYWRKNRVCVPFAECKKKPKPLQCGANEEEQCVKECPPEKTCETRDVAYACLATSTPCKNKCVCKPGFYRNALGDCISEAQCKQCSKPNEFFSCGSACDNECSTLGKQNRTNCPIINIKCNPMCYCKDGYARDSKGNCIPVDKCKKEPKPLQCGPNEIVDDCPYKCGSERCPRSEQEANLSQLCVKPNKCPPPACRCRFNYSRDKNGKCIPTRDCPAFPCKGINEEYNSCPPLCPTDDCSQATPTGKCPFPGRIGIVLRCKPTCRCKKGYWRKNRVCVPFAECKKKPKPLQCGANEEEQCVKECPPEKTCETRDVAYACLATSTPCKNKCVCKTGFYRNALGDCVSEAQCKQCSKPNEFFSCSSACDNECSTLGKQNRTNCPIINIKCNPMCYCKDGYARDSKGNCIPVDKCKKEPKPLQCGPNEIVDDCPYKCGSERCPRSEQEANLSQVCVKPDKCPPPACRCRFNYSRDRNGKCIPTRNCPAFPCEGKNEEYNSCPPLCPTDDCSQATPTGLCPLLGQIGIVLRCQPTCRCKKGYWRKNSVCVPYAECKAPKCGPNEEYVLSKSCPPDECFSLVAKIRCNPDEKEKYRCKCKPGFLRQTPGSPCVPICKCKELANSPDCTKPKPLQCKANEKEKCVTGCPPEKTCKNRKEEFACPAVVLPCTNACVCKPGYVRNDRGDCVSEKQCDVPPLTCTTNEVVKCISSCPPQKTCKNRHAVFACPAVVLPCKDTCVCVPGYVRDDRGFCVREQSCGPLKCKANEEQKCITSCPPQKTCKNRNETFFCLAVVEPCENACVCKKGYIRNDRGDCVPEKQCEPPKCGPNEERVLGKSCPPDTCLSLVALFKCDSNEIDQYRCRCKPGYLRLKPGSPCVRTCKCPELGGNCDKPPVCGRNEVNVFGKSCPPDTCISLVAKFKCDSNEVSRNRCRCKPGYLRLKGGSPCVPQCQCPQLANSPECKKPHKCGNNEEYVLSKSCPPDECFALVAKIKCNANEVEEYRCRCKPGFLRKKAGGPCEPICNCKELANTPECAKPPKCGPNEERVLGKSCPPDTCISLVALFKCDSNEIDQYRCRCKPGYLRLKPGSPCVRTCKCPQLGGKCEDESPVCGRNEVNVFGKSCPPDTCVSLVAKFNCDSNEVSRNRCRCKPGYLRLKEGSPCVPQCQCPQLANSPECKCPNKPTNSSQSSSQSISSLSIGQDGSISSSQSSSSQTSDSSVSKDGSQSSENSSQQSSNQESVSNSQGNSQSSNQNSSQQSNSQQTTSNSQGKSQSSNQNSSQQSSSQQSASNSQGSSQSTSQNSSQQSSSQLSASNSQGKSQSSNQDSSQQSSTQQSASDSQGSSQSSSQNSSQQSSSQQSASNSQGKSQSSNQNSSQQSSTQQSASDSQGSSQNSSQNSSQQSSNQESASNSQGKSQSSNQNSSQQSSSQQSASNSQGKSQSSNQNSSQQSSTQQSASDSQGSSQSSSQNSNQQSSSQESASNSQGTSQSSNQNTSQQSSTQQSASDSQGSSQSSSQNSSQQSSNQQSASNSQGKSQSSNQNSSQQSSTQQSASDGQGSSQSSSQNSSQQSSSQQGASDIQGSSQSSNQNSSQQSSNQQSASNSQGKSQSSNQNSSQQSSTQQSASDSQGSSQNSSQNSSQQSSSQEIASNSQGKSQSSNQNSSQQSSSQQSASDSQGSSQSSSQNSSQQSSSQQSASNSQGSSQSSSQNSRQQSSSQQSASNSQGKSQNSNQNSSQQSTTNQSASNSQGSSQSSSLNSSQQSSSEQSTSNSQGSSQSSSKSSSQSSKQESSSQSSSNQNSSNSQSSSNESSSSQKSSSQNSSSDSSSSQSSSIQSSSSESSSIQSSTSQNSSSQSSSSENSSSNSGSIQCNENEEVRCVKSCPPQKTCDNRKALYLCPAVVKPCKKTCVCKPGYFRNALGTCITEAQCNQCSKPNEFFACDSACDNECSTIITQSRKNCPIKNIVCNEQCYCKDGYARDAKGNCVPECQCPQLAKSPKCKKPCH